MFYALKMEIMTAMEISRLDDRMLQLADTRSPAEISRQLGGVISPTRVAARITELLDAPDWLTDARQDRLVVMKMRKLLVGLENSFNADGAIIDLDNAKVQLSILKAVGDRLDKRRAATDIDLNTYNQNVGRQLGRVVDKALSYMKGALREEVDPERWDELMLEALQEARQEIALHEIQEPV